MQPHLEKSNKSDEIKTQFRAREGYYRLMNSPDYSQRSQRAMGFGTGTANSNSSTASHEKTTIKISLVRVSSERLNTSPSRLQKRQHRDDRLVYDSRSTLDNDRRGLKGRANPGKRDMKICFNVGRELFVYNYEGVRAGPDASNPIYKRYYKGSAPTCHDFNQTTAITGRIDLLVGFSHGQVQLIDLNNCDDQESCKEFNVDRLIDKTRVTCIKWLPNSSSLFLVAHASGQLYLYKDDLPCGVTAPTYQIHKQSEGVCIYTCKTKTTRNPIYRWSIGAKGTGAGGPENGHSSGTAASASLLGSSSSLNKTDNESCALNEFVFSPCGKYLACVSQDGFLRVYCYDTMELIGRARSYYGGLLCVCWSPDGKYAVTGGEDDLITVWSFVERRVVARGMGHKSWISMVAFDSFYTGYDLKDKDGGDYDDEDDDDADDADVDDDMDDEGALGNRGGSNGMLVDEGELENDYMTDEEDYNSKFSQHINHVSKFVSETNMEPRSPISNRSNHVAGSNLSTANSFGRSPAMPVRSYRFGSVGQDTQLCLWDLSDDLLQQPIAKSRTSCIGVSNSLASLTLTQNNQSTATTSFDPQQSNNLDNNHARCNQVKSTADQIDSSEKRIDTTTGQPTDILLSAPEANQMPGSNKLQEGASFKLANHSSSSGLGLLTGKGSGFTKTFSLVGKRDRRYFSQRHSDKNSSKNNPTNSINGTNNILIEDPVRLLGSPICPRMNEVPVIEPTICKKISFERLTSLIFCQGGFITSCQDGYVFSWARPSRRPLRASPGQSNEELRVIDVGTSSAV